MMIPSRHAEQKIIRLLVGGMLITSLCCLTVMATTRVSGLGLFDGHTDIGAPKRSGTVTHDAVTGNYVIGGGGLNMWFRTDAFHFVWTKAEGDTALAADIAFQGTGGNAHRKAVLMIRQTLDHDSAYVDVALHGDGLTSLQFRDTAGDVTHEVQTAIQSPRRLRLEKVGDYIHLSLAGEHGILKPSGCSTRLPFKEPFYLGLGVCAHDENAFETAVFSNVVIGPPSIEVTAVRSSLEFVYVGSADRRSLHHTKAVITAVTWASDGSLFFDEGGHIMRLAPEPAAKPQSVAGGSAFRPGPDQAISPDGKSVAWFKKYPPETGTKGADVLCVAPVAGGQTRELVRLFDQNGVTPAPSWSPDGTKIAYIRYQPAQSAR